MISVTRAPAGADSVGDPIGDASAALHARCGFKPVGIYTEVGRKFGRYWDVAWTERPLKLA